MLAKLSRFLPLAFILFVAVYFAALYYQQIVSPVGGTLTEHVVFAQHMMDGEPLKESQNLSSLPHIGYFYLLIALNKLGFNLSLAAIFVLMQAQVLVFFFTYLIYRHFLKERVSEFFILLGALLSVLVGGIYLPFINPSTYFGIGSPNVHHNSTVILLEPLATLGFFTAMMLFQSQHKDRRLLLLSILVITLSILVKPTFALVFIPALGLWILFQKNLKENLILAFIIFLPAVILLGIQYLSYYDSSSHNRGMTLVFFDVWRLFTTNIPVAILQALAFPLLLTVSRWSSLKYRQFTIVAWLMLIIGAAQFAFISETSNGTVFYSGNWIGGYLIAQSILFTVLIMEYLEWIQQFSAMKSTEKLLFLLTTALLIAHLISGLINDYILFTEGLLLIS